MNVTASISELLYEYECVVLPDFGGFITNNKPARWNRITHQFDPPFKEVLFNVQLKANDGLLVNHVAEKQALSYKTARQEVAAFVNECRTELKSGKRLEFAQIGTLFLDESQHVVFEQDLQTNYNPDAFGLSSLVSPAIKRTSQEEKIKGILLTGTKKKTQSDRKHQRAADERKPGRKTPAFRFTLAIAGLLLMAIVVTSFFSPWPVKVISLSGLFAPSSNKAGTEVKTNQQLSGSNKNNEAGFLPAGGTASDDHGQDLESVITPKLNMDENTDPQAPVVEESAGIDENPVSESRPGLAANEVPISAKTPEVAENPKQTVDKSTIKIQARKRKYYLIAGSFSKEENAWKLVAQLAQKGYPAIVADTNKNGMYRVAYAGYYKLTDARQHLLAIRQKENSEAWLMRK